MMNRILRVPTNAAGIYRVFSNPSAAAGEGTYLTRSVRVRGILFDVTNRTHAGPEGGQTAACPAKRAEK